MTEQHRQDAECVLKDVLERLYERFEPFDIDSSGPIIAYPTFIDRFVRNNDILYSEHFEGISSARYHLRQIDEAFTEGQYGHFGSLFDDLLLLSEEFSLGIESHAEIVLQALDVLSVRKTSTLYTAPPSKPEISQLLLATNTRLVQFLAEHPSFLYKMEPRSFEELVAELLYKSGFEVELTKQTRDGGIDIIAFHHVLDIESKYIFECKRYAMENKVAIDVVQRLYGIKHAVGANKAVVVTTSDFTRDAIKFARTHKWDLELKNYDYLLGWLRRVAETQQP